jgi:hypothetical protein
MNSQPTPYDITAIPFIPYAPGAHAWVALAVVLLCFGLVIVRLTRRRIARSSSPLDLACSELYSLERSISTPHLPRDACFAVSQITKRGIDAAFDTELHASSATALEEMSRSHPSEILRSIAGILALCDIAKFDPTADTAVQRDTLQQLRLLLVSLKHRGIAASPENPTTEEGAGHGV